MTNDQQPIALQMRDELTPDACPRRAAQVHALAAETEHLLAKGASVECCNDYGLKRIMGLDKDE